MVFYIFAENNIKQMLEYINSGNIDALVQDLITRVAIILFCWALMVASSFIDLWSGVDAAKACGEKIQSNGLRRTVSKLGDYFRIELFFLMFDGLGALITWYSMPYASMLGAFAIILIEGKSVVENSKKKKSSAADIPDMLRLIVNASDIEQAKKVAEILTKKKDETD